MADKTSTTKTILSIIVALLVVGGAVAAWATTRTIKAQVDSTQDGRIGTVEADVKTMERRVDGISLKAAEELGVKNAIFDSLKRMETAQSTQTIVVNKLAQDMVQVKTKVENLEKAD